MTILHLSYSKNSEDGGISSAIREIQNNQNLDGISSQWISEKDIGKNNYKNYVLGNIKNLNTHIIHVHGLWRSSSRIYKSYLKENIPYIIAPHGMLDKWALNQSKLKKKI